MSTQVVTLGLAKLIREVRKLKEHVTSVEKQEGPKGEQGVQGPQGERGPQGPTGVQGPAGRDGVVGKDGRDGDRGPAGPQGKAGPKGEKGERGLQGEAGAAGASVEKLELVGGVLYAYINGEKTEAGRIDSTRGGVVWNAGIGGFPDANAIPGIKELIQELSSTRDSVIIEEAGSGSSTLSYTGDLLTLITYADTADITNNTKTLSYDGSDLLETTTHVFNYQSQTWTVTTTLSYTSGKLTGKSKTIGKV